MNNNINNLFIKAITQKEIKAVRYVFKKNDNATILYISDIFTPTIKNDVIDEYSKSGFIFVKMIDDLPHYPRSRFKVVDVPN